MAHARSILGRGILGIALAGALAIAAAAPVAAHLHYAANGHAGAGQVLANGQNHYAFVRQTNGTYLSCDTFGAAGTAGPVGPAWYGLETAHHGSDSGTPGKGDGCYLADSSPATDTPNPAIR